jgi:tryptophanyl-tRNA synthetase
MSNSYGNAIYLSDSEPVIREKVSNMMTDPARKRRSDPGNPDVCPVFAYHKICSPTETVEMVNVECRRAGIGCVEDKKLMADNLVRFLAPYQERRAPYEAHPDQAWDVLKEGSRRAAETAEETMDAVRSAMNLKSKVK